MQVGNNILDTLRNVATASHILSAEAAGIEVFVGASSGSFGTTPIAFSSAYSTPPLAGSDLASLKACFRKLSDALLRGAGNGAPAVSVASGVGVLVWPLNASDPSASDSSAPPRSEVLCSPALSFTVMRCRAQQDGGQGIRVSIESPLSPCGYSGAHVAAAPPPVVFFPPAVWSSVSSAAGSGASLAVTLLEWGIPPVAGASGWNAKSPESSAARLLSGSSGRTDLNEEDGSNERVQMIRKHSLVLDDDNDPGAALRRHLSSNALCSGFFDSAGDVGPQNVSALADRGLDTRVITVTLVSDNGSTVSAWGVPPNGSSAATVFITIPYPSTSDPTMNANRSSLPIAGRGAPEVCLSDAALCSICSYHVSNLRSSCVQYNLC